jgi:hypothetical protein
VPEETEYFRIVVALRMTREAVGELSGLLASLESREVTLLRKEGPTPAAEAEAVIAALQRVEEVMRLA